MWDSGQTETWENFGLDLHSTMEADEELVLLKPILKYPTDFENSARVAINQKQVEGMYHVQQAPQLSLARMLSTL